MKKEISNFLNISERNYYIWKNKQHPKLISLLHILFTSESELNSYTQFNYLAITPQSPIGICDKKKYKQLILKILNLSERNYYIWQNDSKKSKIIDVCKKAIQNEFEAQYFLDNNQLYSSGCNQNFERILDFLVTPTNLTYQLSQKTVNMIFNGLDPHIIMVQNEDDLTREDYIMLMSKYCILQSFDDVATIHKTAATGNDNVRFLLAQTILGKFGQDDKLMDYLTTRELNQIQNNILQNNFKLQNDDILKLIDLIQSQQLYSLLHFLIGIEDSATQIKYFDAFLFFLVAINNFEPIEFYTNYKKQLYLYCKKNNTNRKENRVLFFLNIFNQFPSQN